MTSPDPRDRNGAAVPAAHARHDTFLVAAHAAGDLSGPSRSAAESQIATCSACSALYDDLRAIAGATQSLSKVSIPASVSGRDFRLTPEQAARLDRGRGWRRLLGRHSPGPGEPWTRPLAGALTTLGLAGVLLTTVLPGLGGLAGSGGAASAPERLTVQAAGPTAAPAPAVAPDAVTPAAGAPDAGAGVAGPTGGPSTSVDAFAPGAKASTEPATGNDTGRNTTSEASGPPDAATQATPPPFAAGQQAGPSIAGAPASNAQDGMTYEPVQQSAPPPSVLSVVSVVLIVLGLAIFGLRFVARRYT